MLIRPPKPGEIGKEGFKYVFAAGFDQAALDAAARAGFANGAFEDSPDERAAIVEEFYPEKADRSDAGDGGMSGANSTLRDKLERKATLLGGAAA